MTLEQTIFIYSQLFLGAIAAFLAIFLWPKIRDPAWILIIFGSIFAYIETVYSILKILGVSADDILVIAEVPVIPLILPTIRTLFFIAAFIIMVYRQFQKK